jgi:hypothetical protein
VSAAPFSVHVDGEVLDDLRRRLHATRWPDSVSAVPWQHGADLAYMGELVAYWLDEFDWRRQEAMLNAVLPSHRAQVAGYDIHDARLPGARQSALAADIRAFLSELCSLTRVRPG